MDAKKQAQISNMVMNSLFYLWPFILSIIMYTIIANFITFDITKATVRPTIMAALAGYSFTAAFFLIALPRSGYLKTIDKKNLTLKYALTMVIPAITGILNLTLTAIIEQKNIATIASFTDYLFFTTITYFFWSLFILLSILKQYRNSLE